MLHWVPTWNQGAVAAIVLVVVSEVVRRRRGPSRLTAIGRETGIVLGLFGLWQLAGTLAEHKPDGAVSRGEWVWSLERSLHLPLETSVQHLALPHHWLATFLNSYYVYCHFSGLIIMLIWLFLRHRDQYTAGRNIITITTFACFAVEFVPVAPPRLLHAHGIVDLAESLGQSVYGPVGTGISDQFSAVPSVHIAWASMVALMVWRAASGPWRWVGMVHAGMTWVVVIATGNHYWLDGIVALTILTVVTVTLDRWGRRAGPALVPTQAESTVRPALKDRSAPQPTDSPADQLV